MENVIIGGLAIVGVVTIYTVCMYFLGKFLGFNNRKPKS